MSDASQISVAGNNGHTLLGSNEMDFGDLRPVEVPVRIRGKRYVLVEASGDAGRKYRSAAAQVARFDDGKVVRVEGVGDLEPLLLSMTLYEADAEGRAPLNRNGDYDSSKLVPAGVICLWPDRVQKALFARVKEISPSLEEKETLPVLLKRLEETQNKISALQKDEDRVKNWLAPTAGGSDSPAS